MEFADPRHAGGHRRRRSRRARRRQAAGAARPAAAPRERAGVDGPAGRRRCGRTAPREEGSRRCRSRSRACAGALGSDGVLVTRAPGYELRVEPGGLDAERFAREVEEGERTRSRAATRPPRRGRSARRSRLWRGPPLADLAYHDACRAEIAAAGGAARRRRRGRRRGRPRARRGTRASSADLERLVAEHPLRRAAARPAHARAVPLRPAGRRARGLPRRARRLVEELGVEPGPSCASCTAASSTRTRRCRARRRRSCTRTRGAARDCAVVGRERGAGSRLDAVLAAAAARARVGRARPRRARDRQEPAPRGAARARARGRRGRAVRPLLGGGRRARVLAVGARAAPARRELRAPGCSPPTPRAARCSSTILPEVRARCPSCRSRRSCPTTSRASASSRPSPAAAARVRPRRRSSSRSTTCTPRDVPSVLLLRFVGARAREGAGRARRRLP